MTHHLRHSRAGSLSLAGLAGQFASPRNALEWIANLAHHHPSIGGVQLDATMPGLRPRELDESARRDIASFLRRRGLRCTGVDLFIPPEHYTRSDSQDRAMTALDAAMTLARSVSDGAGNASITTQLPDSPGEITQAISDAANRVGVQVGMSQWPVAALPEHHSPLRIALDPALVLAKGDDPAAQCARLAASILALRLTDASSQGLRVEAASSGGRLRLDALLVSHALLAPGTPLVLDARGLQSPIPALERLAARVDD